MADTVNQPTPEDLEWLRQDPARHAEGFDRIYGPGSATAALTGPVLTTPEAAPVVTPDPVPAPVDPMLAYDESAATMAAVGGGETPDSARAVGEAILDIPGNLAYGVQEAGNETMDFLESADDAMRRGLDAVGLPSAIQITDPETGELAPRFLSYEESVGRTDPLIGGQTGVAGDAYELDLAPVPVTMFGEITATMAQFLAGMVGAGKITRLGGLTGGFVNGAIADAVVMDPEEANLTRFLADNGLAPEILRETLATDPDDPEWTNRVRNVVEGAVAGGLVELTLRGLRALALGRRAEAAGDAAGLAQADMMAAEVADEAQLILDEGLTRSWSPSAQPDPARVSAQEARLEEPPAPARQEGDATPAEATPEPAPRGAESLPSFLRRDAQEARAGAVQTSPRPRLENVLDRAQIEAALARAETITPRDLEESLQFNFDNMDGPFDGLALIQAVAETMEESGISARLGINNPITLAETAEAAQRELSEVLGVGQDRLVRNLARLADDTRQQHVILTAGSAALQSVMREATNVAKEVDRMFAGGLFDANLVDRLIRVSETGANIQAALRTLQSNTGRALSALRIRTADGLGKDATDALVRLSSDERLTQLGGATAVKQLARSLQLARTPAQRARVLRSHVKPQGRLARVVNEVFTNNILSGFSTQALSLTSSLSNMAYLPFERMMGGVVSGIRGMGWEEVEKGVRQYIEMRSALVDSFRIAARTFWNEAPVLDHLVSFESADEGFRAISSARSDALGFLVNTFGKYQRLPSRLLMTQDEFFKQIMFRSRLRANLIVASRRLNPAQLQALGYSSRDEFAAREFENAFVGIARVNEEFDALVAKGKVTDTPEARQAFVSANLGRANDSSPYALDALRVARDATFTTPAIKGSLTETILRAREKHPALQIILPFVRTPANVLSKAFDRMPGPNVMPVPLFGASRQRFRESLRSSDPAVRAEAWGALSTGIMGAAALYMLALEGRITGGGPTDFRKREHWNNDPDWQAYSIRLPGSNTSIAINRLDPWATAFGMAGDLAEIVQAREMDPSYVQDGALFADLAMAVAENITNKSYFSGLAGFMELASGESSAGGARAYLNNLGVAMIPGLLPAAGRQFNSFVNPEMVEARSLADRIKQSVPGLSGDLPVRYNWVTGEPIERPSQILGFINVEKGVSDPVMRELRVLNYGFTGPQRRIGMVSLSTQQFQDWNRLMGSVRIGGLTLHEALGRDIQTPTYDLERARVPDGLTAPEESHRVRILATTIQRYKERARAELFALYPELREAHMQSEIYRDSARRGLPAMERDSLILRFD